jgi:hypothetical protein
MRAIVQDQVSHNFFEGPISSNPANNNAQEESREKDAWHSTLPQGSEVKGNSIDNDMDVAHYDANERYD